MSTEAQRAAVKRYKDKNIRQINIDFNKVTDADILNWLDKQPNRSKAVKDALREAIKQTDHE